MEAILAEHPTYKHGVQ